MPLETVDDYLGIVTHQELDQRVSKDMLGMPLELSTHFAYLLTRIVKRTNEHLTRVAKPSSEHLDSKYTDLDEAESLIQSKEELKEKLASAWKTKSYRDIWVLGASPPIYLSAIVVHRRGSDPLIAADLRPKTESARKGDIARHPDDVYRGLSESFRAEYHGVALEGFYEYLTQNQLAFTTQVDPSYYAKLCSIVQSSGTGKSRLLTELWRKDVIVIYINLREKDAVSTFPDRDSIPADILTNFSGSQQGYEIVCYAFFIGLFEQLDEQLSTLSVTGDAKERIGLWAREMCDVSHGSKLTARSDFFKQVSERYRKVHATLAHLPVLSPDDSEVKTGASSEVDRAADRIQNLTLSKSEPEKVTRFSWLSKAHHKVGKRLQEIFSCNSNEPRVVIAIDEAHPLTLKVATGENAYCPADVLCRATNHYSRSGPSYPIWMAFVSTTSRITDFSPPNKQHNSDRISREGQLLFRPYTQLGWDQAAPSLGEIDVKGVAKFGHIVRYGRPLWNSLRAAVDDPSMVFLNASSKLRGKSFNPDDIDNVLAVLGQRFGLRVALGHPESVDRLERGVASYMRICIGTTADRLWRFTTYPSEPFLSYVAAAQLHSQKAIVGKATKTLLSMVNRGMIDVGQRGELASRLLWLLAKDLFARRSESNLKDDVPKSWKEDALYCKMVPVVGWLEFVFGEQIWSQGEGEQGSLARDAFKDAYLNFSHWVCMDMPLRSDSRSSNDEIDWNELALRHWQRTSAVQCSHQQKLVDKMIPIYFNSPQEDNLAQTRMSRIFISDKAMKSKASEHALHDISRRNKALGGESRRGASDPKLPPYIAILVDLGLDAKTHLTFPERNNNDGCLRIYAAGIDSRTYPFLAEHHELAQNLSELVHLPNVPATGHYFMDYLEAQVKFGSTPKKRHMCWEDWKKRAEDNGGTENDDREGEPDDDDDDTDPEGMEGENRA